MATAVRLPMSIPTSIVVVQLSKSTGCSHPSSPPSSINGTSWNSNSYRSAGLSAWPWYVSRSLTCAVCSSERKTVTGRESRRSESTASLRSAKWLLKWGLSCSTSPTSPPQLGHWPSRTLDACKYAKQDTHDRHGSSEGVNSNSTCSGLSTRFPAEWSW